MQVAQEYGLLPLESAPSVPAPASDPVEEEESKLGIDCGCSQPTAPAADDGVVEPKQPRTPPVSAALRPRPHAHALPVPPSLSEALGGGNTGEASGGGGGCEGAAELAPTHTGTAAEPEMEQMLITDDYLRERLPPNEQVWLAEGAESAGVMEERDATLAEMGGRQTAGRPQSLVGGAGSKPQRSPGVIAGGAAATESPVVGPKPGSGGNARLHAPDTREEGTFDLVGSQLELLKLLQVVMR